MLKIKANKNLELIGELEIPASKSISNRCLIIQALSEDNIKLENLSISDDTIVLKDALKKVENSDTNKTLELNIGLAGTAFRFLCAFLATQKGTYILTGEHRIKERPIEALVNALISLGADIEYLEQKGFAPLLIKGKKLKSKHITIDANISSQFITALLLIAPNIENGLDLRLNGKISSKPYIDMTLNLMNHFGVSSSFEKDVIKVKKQDYKSNHLFIEADWSSASYFYQCLALAKKGRLKLINYSKQSIQGDSKLAELFTQFGIVTEYKKDAVFLTKSTLKNKFNFCYDFSNEPDLAQTFISLCVGLNIDAQITGLESLKIKETNRIEALNNEINSLNWQLKETAQGKYSLQKRQSKFVQKEIIFKTYKDHRMAMCLAPLSLKFGEISIENPEVVSKSNPLFWKQLQSLGFEIKFTQ